MKRSPLCPVCGKHEFQKLTICGKETCPVCGWIYDSYQVDFPLEPSLNPMCLRKAKEMYDAGIPLSKYDHSDYNYQERYPCPVCQEYTFDHLDIEKEQELEENNYCCPVCGWQDSYEQMAFPDKALKENPMSLHDAIQIWKSGGKLTDFSRDAIDVTEYDNLKRGEHLCPVCGRYEFNEFYSYDICPVCGWEDDIETKYGEEWDSEEITGANPCELDEAREKWKRGLKVREYDEE